MPIVSLKLVFALQFKYMKKIVFDAERMKYPDTGLFHYNLNLGKHLEKHKLEDKEALTFFVPQSAQQNFSNCLPQHSYQKFCMPILSNYDIWHATYQGTQYMPMRNKKIKVVLTIHDLNFIYDDTKPLWKINRNLRNLQQLINRADAIVFISEFTQQDVLQRLDLKNKPYYLIYNGSNFLEQPILNKSSYKPKRPFLFSLGVVNRKKNFHTLLPLLQDKQMELLIAGKNDDPNYFDFINETAYKIGLNEHVHLLGAVSEKEKSWYYHNCKAFMMPSISEGFGLPVVEAMSLGKPLFLSNKTALPEIGGALGFYFNDFEPKHMQQVFARGMQMYQANGMAQQLKDRAHLFQWDKAAAAYWEVYRSLY
jgi:glycosyltransferase involved in cell wall biosynthesis